MSKAQAALLAVLFLREHGTCDLGIGDHIGWTNVNTFGVLSFDYAQTNRTIYRNNPGNIP